MRDLFWNLGSIGNRRSLWKGFLKLILGGFVLGNSLVVAVTYFQSVNDFLFHNKLLDHPLTEGDEDWERTVVITDAVMCGFIFLSNMLGMSNPLAKLFNQICNKNIFEIDNDTSCESIFSALIWMGSICKGTISSSSLLSSVRDYTQEWIFSAIGAVISWLANILATVVVLKEHSYDQEEKPWRMGYSEKKAKLISYFVSIGYAASQGFLYQNALYNPLILMGLLEERPLLTSKKYWPLNLSVGLAWLIFIYVTGRTFYKKTLKVIGSDNLPTNHQVTCTQKLNGCIASSFRWLALAAALFGFVLFISSNPKLAILSAGLSLIAAPAVFAVLYPLKEESSLGGSYFSLLGSSPSINSAPVLYRPSPSGAFLM